MHPFIHSVELITCLVCFFKGSLGKKAEVNLGLNIINVLGPPSRKEYKLVNEKLTQGSKH